jgi:hypothetical protein
VVKHAQSIVYEWLAEVEVMLAYHGQHEAEDSEWDEYLTLLRSLEGQRRVRVLVYSEGGRPTREQQHRMTEVLKIGWPVAVVSPSTAVRFVVSVFALDVPAIRLFTLDQLDEAFAHIGCTDEDAAVVRVQLDRMKLAIAPIDRGNGRRFRGGTAEVHAGSRERRPHPSNRRNSNE